MFVTGCFLDCFLIFVKIRKGAGVMTNLILADLQDITNAGVRYILNAVDRVGDIVEAKDKAELLQQLKVDRKSAVVLDYTLFDFASIDELKLVHQRFPAVDWLLFSDELSDTLLRSLIAESLPFSIVLKSCTRDEIEHSLQNLLLGEVYICQRVANHIKTLNKLIENPVDHNLTATEKEILKEVAVGKTTKEIASERNLSAHTVMTHRKNIFRKLNVNNVHEATKYAVRAGIVDVTEYYI